MPRHLFTKPNEYNIKCDIILKGGFIGNENIIKITLQKSVLCEPKIPSLK